MKGISQMSPFQLVVMGTFGALLVIGIILFSTFRSSESGPQPISLQVWGFMDSEIFGDWVSASGLEEQTNITLRYQKKNINTFENELIRALAVGSGPDIFFVSDNQLSTYREFVVNIPFERFSESNFRSTFVEHADIYLTETGISAIPVIIDPLVMFWNRDIHSDIGLVGPIQFWEDLDDFSVRATNRENSTISRSAISFGEYRNIRHAKDIISTLIMQTGGDIFYKEGGVVRSGLDQNFGFTRPPAVSAVSFFVDFADPSRRIYSWNRNLPDSLEYFSQGRSALYLGRAGDIKEIQLRNPNLNFDVAPLPYLREGRSEPRIRNVVTGQMEGLAISRSTKDIQRSLSAIMFLTGSKSLGVLEAEFATPPVRRDMLSNRTRQEFYIDVFYDSAIRSRSWFDPDPNQTDQIIREMIESITGGREGVNSAIKRAHQSLMDIL